MASGIPPIQGPDNPIKRALVDALHVVWIFVDPEQVDRQAGYYRALGTLLQESAHTLEAQASAVVNGAWMDSNGTIFANTLEGCGVDGNDLGLEAMARADLATRYAEHIRGFRRELLSELMFLITITAPIGLIPYLARRVTGYYVSKFLRTAHSLASKFGVGMEFEGVRAGARVSAKQAVKRELATEPTEEAIVDLDNQILANHAGDQHGYNLEQGVKAWFSGLYAIAPASGANKLFDLATRRLRADPEQPGLLYRTLQAAWGSGTASPPAGIAAEATVEMDPSILTDGEKWSEAVTVQNMAQAAALGGTHPAALDVAHRAGAHAGWNPDGGGPSDNGSSTTGSLPGPGDTPGDNATARPPVGAHGEPDAPTPTEGRPSNGAPTGGAGGVAGTPATGENGSPGTGTPGGNAGSVTAEKLGTATPGHPDQSAGSSSDTGSNTSNSALPRPPAASGIGGNSGADTQVRPGSATTNTHPQQQDRQPTDDRESTLDQDDEASRAPAADGERSAPAGGPDRSSVTSSDGDSRTTETPTNPPQSDESMNAGARPGPGETGNAVQGSGDVAVTPDGASPGAGETSSADGRAARTPPDDQSDAGAGNVVVGGVLPPHPPPTSERVLDREQYRADHKRPKAGRNTRNRRDIPSRPGSAGPTGKLAPPNDERERNTTERGSGQDPTAGVPVATTGPVEPVPVGPPASAGAAMAASALAVRLGDGTSAQVASPPEGGPRHTAVGAAPAGSPEARQSNPDGRRPEQSGTPDRRGTPQPTRPSVEENRAAPPARSGGSGPPGPPIDRNPPPTDQPPASPDPDPNDDGDGDRPANRPGTNDAANATDTTENDTAETGPEYAVPVDAYPSWPGDVVPPVGPMTSSDLVPDWQDARDVLDALIEALEYDPWFADRVGEVVVTDDGVVEVDVRSEDGKKSLFRLVATVGQVHGDPPARIDIERKQPTLRLTVSDRLSVANVGIRVKAVLAFALGAGEHFDWAGKLGEDALGISRDPYDVLRRSSRDHGFLALMRYAAKFGGRPPDSFLQRLKHRVWNWDGIDAHWDRRIAERLLTATLHTLGVLQDQPLADRIIDQLPSEDRAFVRELAEGRKAGGLGREPEVYMATRVVPTAFLVVPVAVTSTVLGTPWQNAVLGMLPLVVHTAVLAWQEQKQEGSQAEAGRSKEDDPEGPPRGRLAELLPGMPRVPGPDLSVVPEPIRRYYEKFGWTGGAGAATLFGVLFATSAGNPLYFLLYGGMVLLYPLVDRWFDIRTAKNQARRDAHLLREERKRPDRFENVWAERVRQLIQRLQVATGRLQEFGKESEQDTNGASEKSRRVWSEREPGPSGRGFASSEDQGIASSLTQLVDGLGDLVMDRELQRREAEVKRFDLQESERQGGRDLVGPAQKVLDAMEELVVAIEERAGISSASATQTPGNQLPEVPTSPSPGSRPIPEPSTARFAVYAFGPALLAGVALGLLRSGLAPDVRVAVNMLGILLFQVMAKPIVKWLDKRTGVRKQDEARLGVGALVQDRQLVQENKAVGKHLLEVARYASEQHQRDVAGAGGSARTTRRLTARELRTGDVGTDRVRAAAREARVANATAAVGESPERQAERGSRHRLLREIERRADELDRQSGSAARRRAEQKLAEAYNRYARLQDLGGKPTGLPSLDAVDPTRGRRLTDRLDRLLLQVEQARERLARIHVTDPTLLEPLVLLGQLRRLHWVEHAIGVVRKARAEAERTGDRALSDRVTGELDELITAYDRRLAELGIPGGLAEDEDGEDGGGPSGNGPADNGPPPGPGPTGPAPTGTGPDGSSAANPASAEQEQGATSTGTDTGTGRAPDPHDNAGPNPPSDGSQEVGQGTSNTDIIGILVPNRSSSTEATPARSGARFRSRLRGSPAALLTLGGVLAAMVTGTGTESNSAHAHARDGREAGTERVTSNEAGAPALSDLLVPSDLLLPNLAEHLLVPTNKPSARISAEPRRTMDDAADQADRPTSDHGKNPDREFPVPTRRSEGESRHPRRGRRGRESARHAEQRDDDDARQVDRRSDRTRHLQEQATRARDELYAELAQLSNRQRGNKSVVTGASDPYTGLSRAGRNFTAGPNGKGCAEDDALRNLNQARAERGLAPLNRAEVLYSKARRVRREDPDGPPGPFEEQSICARNCQHVTRPEQYPPGTRWEPGGPWDRE